MEKQEPIFKDKFVVQGHTDPKKQMLMHSANTIRQHSLRVLIAIASTYELRIWWQEVSQDYLQSGEGLLRDVFVQALDQFQLQPTQLLNILKLLYSMTNSGEYCHHKCSSNLQ